MHFVNCQLNHKESHQRIARYNGTTMVMMSMRNNPYNYIRKYLHIRKFHDVGNFKVKVSPKRCIYDHYSMAELVPACLKLKFHQKLSFLGRCIGPKNIWPILETICCTRRRTSGHLINEQNYSSTKPSDQESGHRFDKYYYLYSRQIN